MAATLVSLVLPKRPVAPCRLGMRASRDPLAYLREASTVQLERRLILGRKLDEHQTKIAKRASLTWKEDRAAEVERFAWRIEREPGPIVAKLSCTAAGVRWLIKRWKDFKWACHEGKGYLSDAMRNYVTALLGIPPLFKNNRCEIDAPEGATADEIWDFRKKAIQTRLDDVENLLRHVEEAEAIEHEAALLGIPVQNDRIANRLMREIEACDKILAWIDEQIEQARLSHELNMLLPMEALHRAIVKAVPEMQPANSPQADSPQTNTTTAESPQANATTHVGTVPKVEPRPSPAPQGKREIHPVKPQPKPTQSPVTRPPAAQPAKSAPPRSASRSNAETSVSVRARPAAVSIDFKPLGQRTLLESLSHKFSR